MPKIAYDGNWKPKPATLLTIQRANEICAEYRNQGFDLTLRQLYYQFVARDLLPNSQQSYDKLGATLVKARENGLMDWTYLVDRTRNLQQNAHWDSPQDILDAVAQQFALEKWRDQPYHVEVWVEKEALAGVIARAGRALDVPWFSCRGYTSSSEIWGASQRIVAQIQAGKRVVILHLGDHDPSGLQMSEDIEKRLFNFVGYHVGYGTLNARLEIRRIALSMDQIDQYDPPPNPAKETDSRYTWYVEQTGVDESWELDALEPQVIVDLITEHITELRDDEKWEQARANEAEEKKLLKAVAERWDAVSMRLADELAEEDGEDDDG